MTTGSGSLEISHRPARKNGYVLDIGSSRTVQGRLLENGTSCAERRSQESRDPLSRQTDQGGAVVLLILVAVLGSLLVVPAVCAAFYLGWNPTVSPSAAENDGGVGPTSDDPSR
ncbi:MAG TPA: hypothetical protein VMV16_02880 [Solirubrobacteraceae bacterium]|nr:hypothetical protein [Solirubrobacteraceae bacterium]